MPHLHPRCPHRSIKNFKKTETVSLHHLPSRKGVYSKKYKLGDCVLNKFIKKKKKKHFSTEAEQTPITCFSLCNIEYNLNRLFLVA